MDISLIFAGWRFAIYLLKTFVSLAPKSFFALPFSNYNEQAASTFTKRSTAPAIRKVNETFKNNNETFTRRG